MNGGNWKTFFKSFSNHIICGVHNFTLKVPLFVFNILYANRKRNYKPVVAFSVEEVKTFKISRRSAHERYEAVSLSTHYLSFLLLLN